MPAGNLISGKCCKSQHSIKYHDKLFVLMIVSVRKYCYMVYMHIHVHAPGFLIRILAWTKLAQAKLWVSHCIFNRSNHVYNSNFIVFLSANIWHCMNNIGPSHFTVAPMWPKSYHTTGPKGTFLRHLVRHRTLSKTLTCTYNIYIYIYIYIYIRL